MQIEIYIYILVRGAVTLFNEVAALRARVRERVKKNMSTNLIYTSLYLVHRSNICKSMYVYINTPGRAVASSNEVAALRACVRERVTISSEYRVYVYLYYRCKSIYVLIRMDVNIYIYIYIYE